MKKVLFLIFSASIFSLLSLKMIGQSPAPSSFIKPANITFDSLSNSQRLWASKLDTSPVFSSLQIVEIENFPLFQVNGRVDLQIPGKSCIAQLLAKHVESYSNGDFFWYGEMMNEDTSSEESCLCYDGNLNLLKKNGQFIGTINIGDDFYELHGIGENYAFLVKRSIETGFLRCTTYDTTDSISNNNLPAEERGLGNCPVKVLSLYSERAENAVDDIVNAIHLAINQTNQAFRNSGIQGSDLKLINVGVEKLEDYYDDSFIDDAMRGLFKDPIESVWRQRRDELNADIVLVFAHGYYGSEAGWAYGDLGKAGTLDLDPEYAIAIVGAKYALNGYTGAHEIAHLFGCRHQYSADSDGDYEHAYQFKTGCWPFKKEFKTILWSHLEKNMIQYYSNPEILYKGVATGTESENNARKLRESACIVANFHDDPIVPTLSASISGSSVGCVCEFVTLQGHAHGGANGNYLFEWRTSLDGFNWSIVQGTSTTFTFRLPCDLEFAHGKYIQLTVTSVDGQVDHSFFYVKAEDYDQNRNCERSITIEDYKGAVTIFPNPADDILYVKEEVNIPSDFAFRLYNSLGNIVMEYNQIVTTGDLAYPIHVNNLTPGIYFLEIQSGTIIKTFKVIKN